MTAPGNTHPGGFKVPGVVIVVGILVILAGPLAAVGCGVNGKSVIQTFLEQQRGKPPAFEPHHAPETRAALEQLSRASSVAVELPSSSKSGLGVSTWCASGNLTVGGRKLPFGVIFSEQFGKQRVDEMSLTRLRCHSANRSVSLR